MMSGIRNTSGGNFSQLNLLSNITHDVTPHVNQLQQQTPFAILNLKKQQHSISTQKSAKLDNYFSNTNTTNAKQNCVPTAGGNSLDSSGKTTHKLIAGKDQSAPPTKFKGSFGLPSSTITSIPDVPNQYSNRGGHTSQLQRSIRLDDSTLMVKAILKQESSTRGSSKHQAFMIAP